MFHNPDYFFYSIKEGGQIAGHFNMFRDIKPAINAGGGKELNTPFQMPNPLCRGEGGNKKHLVFPGCCCWGISFHVSSTM
jgi:hypothetical protein